MTSSIMDSGADFEETNYWAASGKPSYKMSLVFPSGTNRTLACSARAQDISVCVECVE